MGLVNLVHVYLIVDRCTYDGLDLKQVERGLVVTVPGQVNGKLNLNRGPQCLLDDIKDLHQ